MCMRFKNAYVTILHMGLICDVMGGVLALGLVDRGVQLKSDQYKDYEDGHY
jgi:hypothetical protein